MVTATPDTFLAVLKQLMNDSIAEAERAPGKGADRLGELLQQAEDRVANGVNGIKRLPGDIKDKIDELLDPPDWWSLLLLLMAKVRELDPYHMSVGTTQPQGWVRMVTLTYTPDELGAGVTLGLGLVKSGALTRGLMVRASQGEIQTPQGGPVHITITSSGGGEWAFPFGGSVEPPTVQSAELGIKVVVWGNNPPVDTPPPLMLQAGRMELRAQLRKPGPLYDVSLSLGAPSMAKPGIHAELTLPEGLPGFVSVALPQIEYTPTATFKAGSPPAFSLGERKGS